jgi:hypothetical protein
VLEAAIQHVAEAATLDHEEETREGHGQEHVHVQEG